MHTTNIKDLIEQAYEQEYRRQTILAEKHAEAVRERDLGECYDYINEWRKSYFRKNSAKRAAIYLKAASEFVRGDGVHSAGFVFYKRLQLFVDGKLLKDYYVRPEAFDTLTMLLEKSEYPGMDIYTYLSHQPREKKI